MILDKEEKMQFNFFSRKKFDIEEEFYDFGKAKIHAGPINDKIIKEVHRLDKILEIEKILEEIENGR